LVKPAVFIGGSSQVTELALAIQGALDDVADVTLFTQGVARLSTSSLDTFIEALDSSDCAVFVFSAEEAASREARDALFQLGLMVGRMGRGRTFVVVPGGTGSTPVPTPLQGMTVAEYDVTRLEKNPQAAVGKATALIREALKRLEPRAEEQVLKVFPATFESRLERAETIYFWGMNQSDFLIQHYETLVNRLQSGSTLRALLANPEGAAVKLALLRFPGEVDADHDRNRARSSLSRLSALRKRFPANVQIRTLDYLFSHGAFLIDAQTPAAVAFVKYYTFRTSGGSRKPKHIYEKGRTRWFELTCAEGEQLWLAGSDWPNG
jgi:hypothetical protein